MDNFIFSKHQVLNITDGHLYTNMDDVYAFFESVITPGIFTHMLPNARLAILPILEKKLNQEEYFGVGYHPLLPNPEVTLIFTDEDREEFWKNYGDLPSPFEGKKGINVTVRTCR